MRISDERYAYLRSVYLDEAGAELPEHERLALKREYVTLFQGVEHTGVRTVTCASCGRGAYQYGSLESRCHGCAGDVVGCPCPPKQGWVRP